MAVVLARCSYTGHRMSSRGGQTAGESGWEPDDDATAQDDTAGPCRAAVEPQTDTRCSARNRGAPLVCDPIPCYGTGLADRAGRRCAGSGPCAERAGGFAGPAQPRSAQRFHTGDPRRRNDPFRPDGHPSADAGSDRRSVQCRGVAERPCHSHGTSGQWRHGQPRAGRKGSAQPSTGPADRDGRRAKPGRDAGPVARHSRYAAVCRPCQRRNRRRVARL